MIHLKIKCTNKCTFIPILLYGVISLTIATFLFKPGYLFLLDMVFGAHIDLADYTTNGLAPHFPVTLFLHLLSYLFPVNVIQKLLLFSILLLIGSGMYYLALKFISRWWAFIAGLIYLLNPYVYERFAAGQWLVLLGYGYFPLVFMQLLNLIFQPTKKNILIFSILYSLFPILNIHWWYIGSAVMVVYGGLFAVINKPDIQQQVKNISKSIATIVGVFLTANIYWLLNFFSPTKTITNITTSDLSAFTTVTDPKFGVFYNVLSLYGFWSTEFVLPKDLNAYWWVATLITLILSLVGLFALYKRHKALALTLVITMSIALIIAVGLASDITKPLTLWLSEYLPGFKGLRDTAKVIGILAFGYALLVPVGARFLSHWLKDKIELPHKVCIAAMAMLTLSIPLVVYPSMANSFNGQLQPHQYPASWRRADILLTEQKATNVLILPWHGYLEFPFSQNHPIANPAKVFFTPPVTVSSYLDNPNLDRKESKYDQLIYSWLKDGSNFDEDIAMLKSEHFSHILLFKTVDYKKYNFLNTSSKIEPLLDSNEIAVYKIKH